MKLLAVTAIGALSASAGMASAAPLAPRNPPSITSFVAASGGTFDRNRFDYDILLNAVQTAGLAEALANPDADLTLFAPNDQAFIRLARDLGYEGSSESGAWTFLVDALTDLGEGDPIPVLTAVLTYHVLPERVSAVEVIIASLCDEEFTTLQGGTIRPDGLRLEDNEPDLADPVVFVPFNVRTGNGIVHTISRVLIPLDLP